MGTSLFQYQFWPSIVRWAAETLTLNFKPSLIVFNKEKVKKPIRGFRRKKPNEKTQLNSRDRCMKGALKVISTPPRNCKSQIDQRSRGSGERVGGGGVLLKA